MGRRILVIVRRPLDSREERRAHLRLVQREQQQRIARDIAALRADNNEDDGPPAA